MLRVGCGWGDFVEFEFVLHSSGGLRARRSQALDPEKIIAIFWVKCVISVQKQIPKLRSVAVGSTPQPQHHCCLKTHA